MRYFVLTIIASVILTSCSPSAQKKAEAISTLEKNLDLSAKKNVADTAKLKQLLKSYEDYYTHFPDDSMSPIYLMRSGDFDRALGLPDQAAACYHQVYTHFPKYPKANMALFLEGFTYENDKHDLVKAKEAYSIYLDKFPTSKMSRDVKFLLDHLGKTPDQIMAEVDSLKKTHPAADSLGYSRK